MTITQSPAISLSKHDGGVITDADGIVDVGDTVTYSYVVTNTGDVTLTNLTVTDPMAVSSSVKNTL